MPRLRPPHRSIARLMRAALALSLGLATGCAALELRQTYQLAELAQAAERKGEIEAAERAWERALGEARFQRADADLEASIQYELGRMKGQRCKTEEARALFQGSIRHADSSGASPRTVGPRLCELAYLESNAGRFAEALPAFERCVAIARNGYERSPGFADVLHAFSIALDRTGAHERAAALEAEAQKLAPTLPKYEGTPLTLTYRAGCARVARERGDYAEVLRQQKAVLDEALVVGDRARLVTSVYEAGRAAGVICRFDEAEAYLLDAYALDQQTNGLVRFDLVELARLKLDQRAFADSLTYFERALAVLEREGAPTGAPIAFADILDEHASALEQTGAKSDAERQRARAREIRAQHPYGTSITERTPYAKQCSAAPYREGLEGRSR